MQENYSGEEVIQIAMGEEKDAIVFYKAAMDISPSSKAKDIFHFLLHEEEKHLILLEKEILPIFKGEEFTWENEEILFSYLRSTGKSSMYQESAKATEFMKENKGTMEIIEYAMGMERKAIEFYKITQTASSQNASEALSRVIAEEATHIQKLNELKVSMKND